MTAAIALAALAPYFAVDELWLLNHVIDTIFQIYF